MDGLFRAIFLQGDKRPLTLNYKEAPKAITLEDVKNESPANRTGSTLDDARAPKRSTPLGSYPKGQFCNNTVYLERGMPYFAFVATNAVLVRKIDKL